MAPTPAQLKAIQSNADITFAIAGPGSGKTRTLIWRILHLIESGVSPANIACITFTNAAAREIEHRIDSAGCPPVAHPGFCTPESQCDATCMDRANYVPPVLGYVGTLHGFMLKLLRSHGAAVGWGGGRITVLDEEETDHLIKECWEAQSWKGTAIGITDAIAKGPPVNTAQFSKADLVAAAFWEKLRRRKAITFDGLLIVGRMLLAKVGDPTGFAHYLIDEVQDSSDIDFEIYKLLKGNLWLAGDTDQSIYGFRGANVRRSMEMAELPNSTTVVLEENFRSGSFICAAAQNLIEHNKKRWPKKTISFAFEGGISVCRYESPTVEAMAIGQSIASQRDLSHAVLVRTNALVQEYANQLRAMSIPVAEAKLVIKPHDWKRLMVNLAFMENPNDDHACYRWLEMKNGKEFADTAKKRAMTSFTSINRSLTNLEPCPIKQITTFLRMDGITEATVARVSSALNGMPSKSTIGDLMIELSRQDIVEEGHGVTVTTMHGAKGREWDVVFLPAFEQHIIPGKRANLDIEEERRLAYVGVTRARQQLFVSYCDKRVIPWSGTSQPQPVSISQFASEMGL